MNVASASFSIVPFSIFLMPASCCAQLSSYHPESSTYMALPTVAMLTGLVIRASLWSVALPVARSISDIDGFLFCDKSEFAT